MSIFTCLDIFFCSNKANLKLKYVYCMTVTHSSRLEMGQKMLRGTFKRC